MLQLTDAQKALFLNDGVKKDFFVIFPNGELPTITNENVVRESVRYTESICSQDTFKFGLAEASVLEFETVGVENMFGMTIDAFIAADLGKPGGASIYLGRYIVDKCPRNHGAMTHRRVTAYSVNPQNLKALNYYEAQKLSMQYAASMGDYTVKLGPYILAQLEAAGGVYGGGFEDRFTQTWRGYNSFDTSTTSTRFVQARNTFPGQTDIIQISVVITYQAYNLTPDDVYQTDGMYWGNAYSDVTNYILNECTRIGYNPLGYGTLLQALWNAVIFPGVSAVGNTDLYFDEMPPMYLGGIAKQNPVLYCPVKAVVSGPAGFETSTFERTAAQKTGQIGKTEPNGTDPLDEITVSFGHTLEYKISGNKYASFVNALSPFKLINGYFELRGQFLGATYRDTFATYGYRGTAGRVVSLSDASPVEIAPGEYSEMWWDEYDVSPIGTVRYSYGENENTYEYNFDEAGLSVYDMTENYVLQHMADASPSAIEALLDDVFIPNVQDVVYTPVDLEMRGLPYLEAGDALEITAEDGTIVNTYMMRREMSGIQALFDAVESKGGEIIGSEEEDE